MFLWCTNNTIKSLTHSNSIMIDIHTKLHTMFGISTVVHIDNSNDTMTNINDNGTFDTRQIITPPSLFKTQRKMLIHQCTHHFFPTPYGVLPKYLSSIHVIFSLPPNLLTLYMSLSQLSICLQYMSFSPYPL